MFDIGFLELVLIGVVALLVIGPSRLPEVARTVGVYVGRFRRFVSSVQEDINREVGKHEELTRLLEEQKKIVEEHQILEELNQPVVPDQIASDEKTRSEVAEADPAVDANRDGR